MIRSITYPFQDEKQARFFKWSVFILGLVFFLNCFSPLRIHYDMLRYFAIKDCIESKCPPGADVNDYLPYGYTTLLLLLSKLVLLKPFSIIFINCLYLSGGLYFVRKIFNGIRSPFFLFFLVLLNWTVIKFVVHPLSELQYLFFSLAGISAFNKFVRNKNMWNLLLALLLAGAAFLTRTVGITLVTAIFVSLIWEYRKQLMDLVHNYKLRVLAVLLSAVIVAIFSKQLGLNHYTSVLSNTHGVRYSEVILWHFSEWGEILMNVSRFKVVGFLPAPVGDQIFIFMGILGFCGFVYVCFIKKNNIPFIVKSYLFFYLLLMFNWPFSDPRFWVPIIPLIAGVISQTSSSDNQLVRSFSFLYLLVYSTLGLISVGFLTYSSLNKKELSKTQAKGIYRNEYEVHFFGKPLSDTAKYVDPRLVDFLNKYDK